MELYVVFDTKGAGRLVGVFGTLSKAQSVTQITPQYFRLWKCELDAVNPEILGWALDDAERELLSTILAPGEDGEPPIEG